MRNLQDKQCYDEKGNPLKDTTIKDRKAEFPGGAGAWAARLKKAVRLPENYQLTNGDAPVVVVEATINEEGQVTDAEVVVPFYPDFDKIALEAVQKSPNWIPAFERNRAVKYTIREPVIFGEPDEPVR